MFCIHMVQVVYLCVAMPQSNSNRGSSKKGASSKVSGAVRDLKPVSKRKSDFTVKEIDLDDIPFADPLEEDSNFEVNKVEMDIDYEPARPPRMEVHAVKEEEQKPAPVAVTERLDEASAREFIKVRFGTFVNLIANRELEEVFDANADQQIIMNSNLLTELAGSKDRREDKKIPLVFVVGIAIGVVLTYIFFST